MYVVFNSFSYIVLNIKLVCFIIVKFCDYIIIF